MSQKSQVRPKSSFDSQVWIAVGVALGTGIGSLVHDVSFGIAIGLMGGGVATILAEKRKTPSRLVAAVGVLALVTTIGTEIILRT